MTIRFYAKNAVRASLVLFLFVCTFEAEANSCESRSEHFGDEVSIRQMALKSGCTIMVAYRDSQKPGTDITLLFSDDGKFQILSTYLEAGAERLHSQSYMVFPSNGPFGFTLNSGDLTVHAGWGSANFEAYKAKLKSIPGFEYLLSRPDTGRAPGKLFLERGDGRIILDGGSRLNFPDSLFADEAGISEFIDPNGKKCSFQNHRLFDYREDQIFLRSEADIIEMISSRSQAAEGEENADTSSDLIQLANLLTGTSGDSQDSDEIETRNSVADLLQKMDSEYVLQCDPGFDLDPIL